jgi:hypothetical protein
MFQVSSIKTEICIVTKLCQIEFSVDFVNYVVLLVFKDTNTPSPFIETFPNDENGEHSKAAEQDHIYLDAMGFGMGCCCLQVSFHS